MITSKFILLAKSVTIDYRTQLLSIGEVIEELTATAIPAILSESKLIAVFERDKGSDESKQIVTVTLKNNEKEIGKQDVEIDFQDKKRNRMLLEVPPFNLTELGKLTFLLSIKGKVVAEYSTDINLVKVVN